MIDDESESDVETDVTASEVDEEAVSTNGEAALLLKRPHNNRSSLPDSPCKPAATNGDLLNIARLRRHGVTESEEIWEELQDDRISELSPFSRRKSSARSTSPSKVSDKSSKMDKAPTESTALFSRAGTGRSYRDKGRRRSTHLTGTPEHGRRRKSVSSQDALGGWWKMKQWWKRKEGRSTLRGNDNGDGA